MYVNISRNISTTLCRPPWMNKTFKVSNSLRPSDTIWWNTKPLPEPMLIYYEKGFCGILQRAISQEMLKISVGKMSLIITISKTFSHLPGVNELKHSWEMIHTYVNWPLVITYLMFPPVLVLLFKCSLVDNQALWWNNLIYIHSTVCR